MSTPDKNESVVENYVKGYRFAHQAPAVNLQALLDLMASLRAPDGCPWDRAQTFESLLPYLHEESAEYTDAVLQRDPAAMREELGDVLLQIVFHAQIAREQQWFNLQEVVDGLVDKLWSRHPHVFGGQDAVSDASAVEDVWTEQKRKERAARNETETTDPLARVPASLPPLARAYALGKAAAKIGFDFESAAQVIPKVQEELQEVQDAMTSQDRVHTEEEIGDLLFSVVNLARKLKIAPDTALAKANVKFMRRMGYVAEKMSENGLPLAAENQDAMEAYWNEARAARIEATRPHNDPSSSE